MERHNFERLKAHILPQSRRRRSFADGPDEADDHTLVEQEQIVLEGCESWQTKTAEAFAPAVSLNPAICQRPRPLTPTRLFKRHPTI